MFCRQEILVLDLLQFVMTSILLGSPLVRVTSTLKTRLLLGSIPFTFKESVSLYTFRLPEPSLKAVISSHFVNPSLQEQSITVLNKSNRDRYNGSNNNNRTNNRSYLISSSVIAGLLSSLGFGSEEEETIDPDTKDPLKMTIKRGILCMDRGNHEEAEAIFHAALKMATDLQHVQATDYIYLMMARNAMEQRDLKKAEALYKEVMRRILGDGRAKESDESVVEISLHLATIYGENEEYEKAEEGFKYCLHHQKPRVKDLLTADRELNEDEKNSLALYAMILDWFSKYAVLRKNNELAYQYMKECLQISKKFLPETDEQLMILYSDFGVACERIGKIDEAITNFKEAVNLATDSGNVSSSIGVFFYNLGMCYLRKRDVENAHFCCLRALKFANDATTKKFQIKCRRCLKEVEALRSGDVLN